MPPEITDAESKELRALLEFLKDARGFDFMGYKRSTLRRRIEKRMAAVGVDGCSEYQEYLEVNPREFTELFNTILINVTAFFRDPTAWDFLSGDVIPELLEARPDPDPIRVWSAGCASGEEPYTAAMLLCEAMGEEAFARRVKIYATDWDEDALADARNGVYSNDAAKGIPEPFIDKYFVPNPRGVAFRPELRRKVIFGRNDLVADAPISRIDLLICRNVLMYFTPETQARILERFNFALHEAGYLFLGKSEMLVGHSEFFSPYDTHARVFRKVQRANLRERLAFIGRDERFGGGDGELAVRTSAAAMSPVAQIVVDAAGVLVDANLSGRALLAIGEADLGRPFRDLALSYRPLDLRGAIDNAYDQGTPVKVGRVEWSRRDGEESILEVEVSPVPGSDGQTLGATIVFTDVTMLARAQQDYQRSSSELETAYEELQSTVEELETTNEELQSTNEELETTNEELQSTNEELETMNEELQSTNDELETMNTEVHSRAGELDKLNVFLEGILGTLGVGVAVIDQDRNVQVWNAMATEMWGVRADEVDRADFMSLDIGLPVNELDDAIARAFGGATSPIEERVNAVNRRGRAFECVVRVMPLRSASGEIYGAMLLTTPAPAS
jgi:two-component system, chemotaxis family, CheB/CheR fusion protein